MKTTQKAKYIIILSASLSALTGCSSSDIKENLGLKKYAPDEFMVVSRPALTMPPSYALVEPKKKEILTSESKSDEAKSLLIGNKKSYKSYISDSEKSLLSKAGTSKNKQNIREVLNKEYTEYVVEKKEHKESLLSKLNPFNNNNEETLDAKKEKQRLINNQKEGKSVTEGESESIAKNSGIFN